MLQYVKRGDTDPLEIGLEDSRGVIGLDDVDSVIFAMKKASYPWTLIVGTCEVVDADLGLVTFTPQPTDFDIPGVYNAEFIATWRTGQPTEQVVHVPNDGYEEVEVLADLSWVGPPEEQVPLLHVEDTIDVHGIADTSLLATTVALAAVKAGAMGYVNHGSNANVARPSGYAAIQWVGSVEPLNRLAVDLWFETP